MPVRNVQAGVFDFVDELLFASAQDCQTWVQSGGLEWEWLAPRGGLLDGPALMIAGSFTVMWDRGGPLPTGAIKILTLPVRRQGMERDAFAAHWTQRHPGLALEGEGTKERLRRLEATLAGPLPAGLPPGIVPAPFDGIGVIRFDSKEDLDREFASAHYREVMAPDEPRFTDPSRSNALMVREVP